MYIPFYGVVASISTIMPILVALFRWRGEAREEVGIFFYYLLFGAFSASTQLYLATQNINNLWISHISAFAEVTLALMAYRSWQKSEVARIVLLAIVVFFALTWSMLRFLEDFATPSLIAFPIARAVVMIASFHMLYVLARDSDSPLLEMPRFWIVATTMISGAAAIMFFALQGVITKMQVSEVVRVFYAYWTLTVLLNCAYSWSFICKTYRPSSGGR